MFWWFTYSMLNLSRMLPTFNDRIIDIFSYTLDYVSKNLIKRTPLNFGFSLPLLCTNPKSFLLAKDFCCYHLHSKPFKNLNKELFIWEKSSHPGETSHLSEILAEWYIKICKNKSFIWELIHPTQVRSHLNVDEISLRLDDFSPRKQFLWGCPT